MHKLPRLERVWRSTAARATKGAWSHNDISNIGSTQQCYAYDFGHDHQQPVCAARSGIVWSFTESNADNASGSGNLNLLTVMHTTNDSVHDDPFGTGAVTTFA